MEAAKQHRKKNASASVITISVFSFIFHCEPPLSVIFQCRVCGVSEKILGFIVVLIIIIDWVE